MTPKQTAAFLKKASKLSVARGYSSFAVGAHPLMFEAKGPRGVITFVDHPDYYWTFAGRPGETRARGLGEKDFLARLAAEPLETEAEALARRLRERFFAAREQRAEAERTFWARKGIGETPSWDELVGPADQRVRAVEAEFKQAGIHLPVGDFRGWR